MPENALCKTDRKRRGERTMENTNVQEVKMPITYDDLKKIGVVLQRDLNFIA